MIIGLRESSGEYCMVAEQFETSCRLLRSFHLPFRWELRETGQVLDETRRFEGKKIYSEALSFSLTSFYFDTVL